MLFVVDILIKVVEHCLTFLVYVEYPTFQESPRPLFSEVMESCPRENIENLKDQLKEENLYIMLRGYIAIAIDSRYHGERAAHITTYGDVWDLIKLDDYLTKREDIYHSKIKITGESLGGMHAWFASFVDTRYAVVIPIIGVQGFRWAIDNDKWHARVDSIKLVFIEAVVEIGKNNLDKEVVEKVWDRIAPGLASKFDSPDTIPAIAPRPLLILNGAEDPRCPLEGLNTPISKAQEAYKAANCSENFEACLLIAQPGIGHQMTLLMVKEASQWFDRFLK
ncbi:hypothetical protein IFM89_008374 [Coptis chinensis]|uniref:Peptidase S9 prolyl oligopeptidase catalytic domain-containing protein n=1 Tax=Coptis chinensis TaxID=261450 RepID=A0A835INZ1_9MAGN|nr:hypothetical protein IFM89_008374 [Coptis chinensis]